MAVPSPFVQQPGLGSVTADQLNTYVQTVQNFAQLRTFTGLSNMSANVLGGTALNDGAQGLFSWNGALAYPTDDGANVIVPSGCIQGAWVRGSSATLVTASILTVTVAQNFAILPNLAFVVVELCGDGGGGAGVQGALGVGVAGGGGGSGGYSRQAFTLAQLQAAGTILISIGQGGQGGTSGNSNGQAGAGCSFGALMTVNGGLGGQYSGAGGIGGAITVTPGAFANAGSQGGAGFFASITTVPAIGGYGASSAYSGSAQGSFAAPGAYTAGRAGLSYGGGGAGGAASNTANAAGGGAGAPGACIITQFFVA